MSTRRHPRHGRLAGVLLRTQPDERLVAMTREGGSAAFDEIVRRHRPALMAFAGSLAPPSRAEDVVQDSLLKAYGALQDGAEPELLRAWLFRIVRNAAIDEQRGLRYHEQLDESYDGVEQPPQAMERRERIAALVAAIRDLPAAQREAIVGRELEGRGHKEIGRALDVSAGAVRQLIYRARHTLREAAGALVPAALMRAASLPGANEAVGGLGMAGATKLGLAALVATGTIVAGTSLDRHDHSGTADALQVRTPGDRSQTDASETSLVDRRGDDRGRPSGGEGRHRSGDRGPGDRSGSDDDGHGGNSGPGSASSGPGPGPSSDGLDHGGSGSSGPGSGDGSVSSGPGGGGSTGRSGSDDPFAPTEATSSSSGPG